MATDHLRLPAANEFTPGQLGGAEAIFELLDIIKIYHGNPAEVVEHIRQTWFQEAAARRVDPSERLVQQTKRARNVVTGMRQYGLLTTSKDPLVLTELAVSVLDKRDMPTQAYEEFARFVLREKCGLELLEIARRVKARDGVVTKRSVDAELSRSGFIVSTNSAYSGKLRQWLEAAKIVDMHWNIDEAKLAAISGIQIADIGAWQSLTAEQRATLEVMLARDAGNKSAASSTEVLALLRARNVSFDGGQVRKKIYEPLENLGWIKHTVDQRGRGGKGGLIALTDRARSLDLKLLNGVELGDIPAELQQKLVSPTAAIIADLTSLDTGVKGTALELLALRLAADIGLMPVDLRLRGSQTGGAEVDLVAEGAHLHFSRWLFQCKNQSDAVPLSVLAKEIGMASLLKAQVVVIVTTSTFARTVLEYAKVASETTAVQVILIDGSIVSEYKDHGTERLREYLHSNALAAMRNKRSQVREVPVD